MLLALLPASASAASLAGTSWRVTRVGGDVVPRSAQERLDFKTTTRFTGRSTCGNSIGGRYRADATRLRFRDVVSSAIGCARPAPPDITGAILHTRGYRVGTRTLELLGRRGRTLAVLRQR